MQMKLDLGMKDIFDILRVAEIDGACDAKNAGLVRLVRPDRATFIAIPFHDPAHPAQNDASRGVATSPECFGGGASREDKSSCTVRIYILDWWLLAERKDFALADGGEYLGEAGVR